MLTAAFPKLDQLKFTRLLRAFFRSTWYPALIVALMVCAEVFGLEFPVYYIYLVIGILCMLFDRDALGVLPIVCCIYMTFSAQNNPGYGPKYGYTNPSAFLKPQGIIQLIFLGAVAAVFLIGRLVLSIIEGKAHRGRPKLLFGFIALTVGYVLAGVTSTYELRSVLYGLLQVVSLSLFYFYFFFTVDWSTVKESYIFTVFLWIGVGIFLETVGMYFLPGVFRDGKVVRENLYAGWGVYNAVGCVMAMCLPAPFYFAAKRKNSWLYTLLGCVFFLGIILTQSRGAILFGSIVFLACVVVMLVKAKGKDRIGNMILLGALVVALVIIILIFRKQVQELFSSLINAGSSGRFEIYRACWETFLSSPAFGKGFYHTPGARFSEKMLQGAVDGSFIPPRAHNTFLQLLATGGVVALAAYLYHRFETLWLLFRHPTTEKTFIALSIAALLLTSLVDINFFNFGPGLLYSVLLVCAERPVQK